MSVRAKFTCTSKSGGAEDGAATGISLQPVYTGSKENESFFQATPGGSISLSVVNGEAAKQFVVGKQYYVDFTPAEE